MSVYGELPRVVESLRYQRELLQVADVVAQHLYQQQPSFFEVILESQSLEAYDQGPNLLRQPIQEGSKNIEDASSKTKIITWEEHKKNRVPSFKYEKDKAFQRKTPVPKSSLAMQLGDLPRPKKQHEVQVFAEGIKEPVRIPVTDRMLVSGVIEFAIRQFDAAGKPLASNVPKFWWLRLASKQGVPENEIPPLRHHERFLDVAPPNSGCTVFALTKNDKYDPNDESGISDSGTVRERGDKTPGHGTLGRKQTLRPSLKVNLPNGEHVYAPWQGDMKVGQLLVSVCKKRMIDACNHTFQIVGTDTTVDPDITLEQLDISAPELNLVEVEPSGMEKPSKGKNIPPVLVPARAIQWQQFKVTKLKKNPFGKKEIRVLGIDRHLISNDSTNRKKTKRPSRLMKEVKEVGLISEAKPKQFYITYLDPDKGKEYRYDYEAQSADEAAEIVAKIECIKALEKSEGSVIMKN